MSKKKLFQEINEPSSGAPHGILLTMKNRYRLIMISLVILGIVLYNYMQGNELLVMYVFLALLLGACYMMYENLYYFQRMGLQYRPFLMTQYFELMTVAGVSSLIIHTLPYAQASGAWFRYGLLWVFALGIRIQFRWMFMSINNNKDSDAINYDPGR